MCDDHFKQRAEDDDKIKDLEGRIAETRKHREESKAIRNGTFKLKVLIFWFSSKFMIFF